MTRSQIDQLDQNAISAVIRAILEPRGYFIDTIEGSEGVSFVPLYVGHGFGIFPSKTEKDAWCQCLEYVCADAYEGHQNIAPLVQSLIDGLRSCLLPVQIREQEGEN